MNRARLERKLRALVKRAGSQRALAAEMGITQAYLSDVLNGHRHPGPAILKFLGLTRTYTKEGTP